MATNGNASPRHQIGGASICCLLVSTEHGGHGFHGPNYSVLPVESRKMPPTSLGSPDSSGTGTVRRVPPPTLYLLSFSILPRRTLSHAPDIQLTTLRANQ
ncbi:hypothetical protein ATANTOWER_001099 [Ataeniobius toweri]|uniref:Uncharacterized protein n=1 Tax=Ataeniobius toweri TaxID=208326 RepID=A0ABU7BQ27_9TELE|nr:hypothetical protein [Ataeniobius toweri]